MRIDIHEVELDGILPATSAVLQSGRMTVAVAETEQGPTILSLIAGGRMRPDAGSVSSAAGSNSVGRAGRSAARAGGSASCADHSAARADHSAGAENPAGLRAIATAVALVDTPGVAEPPAAVRLSAVVAEELMLAGRASGPRAVRDFLRSARADGFSRAPMNAVPSAIRLTVLCSLAAVRPGVEALVITSPERHGGSAREWSGIAQGFADRGLGVLVVTSRSAAASVVSRPSSDLVAARSPRSLRRTYLESTR